MYCVCFLSLVRRTPDEEWNSDTSNVPEVQTVGFRFTRASLETFAAHGITEIGIYVYLSDSLVYGENLPLNDGNLEVDVPLGRKTSNICRG